MEKAEGRLCLAAEWRDLRAPGVVVSVTTGRVGIPFDHGFIRVKSRTVGSSRSVGIRFSARASTKGTGHLE